MQLSVIIVNYNVKFFLEQCLHSVIQAMRGMEGEILVVDNASTDGSAAYFTNRFPQVQFFWQSENIGFAKANNYALQKAKGALVLFLNPDTLVPEDCFEKCIAFMQAHADAGALGVQMIDGSGKFLPESKRALPSILPALFRLSRLSQLFPHSSLINRYHLGHLSAEKNHVVEVLAGAFMLVRKKVLDQIGGFDERFFMYGEDIDLSYRIQQAGWNNYYFSECRIVHFKGESTRKHSLHYVKLFYEAMSIFVKKHYTGTQAILFRFLIQTGIWIRASLSLLKRMMRPAVLPLVDALIIFSSFSISKTLWSNFIRTDVRYIDTQLNQRFLLFTLLFLSVGYLAGLYEKKLNPRKLGFTLSATMLSLLLVYGLLPEYMRFSRGMIVLGASISSMALIAIRWGWLQLQVIEKAMPTEKIPALVLGTGEDFENVKQHLAAHYRIADLKGFVSPLPSEAAMDTIQNIEHVIKGTPVKAVIICQSNVLSFGKSIALFHSIGSSVKLYIHAAGSRSIVGSTSRDEAGEAITAERNYRLAANDQRRKKRIADIGLACLLLICFPIHLVVHPNAWSLLGNAKDVLLKGITWIGYKTNATHLPPLSASVLNGAGLPHSDNLLSYHNQLLTDEWYAQEFDVFNDVQMVVKSYKKLGAKQH